MSVAAAVVVNAAGSAGRPGDRPALGGPAGRLAGAHRRPSAHALDAAVARAAPPPLNTTIGVVLTDAALTKAQAGKVAAVAHDGLARAIRPVHSMMDGDTIFCLASGRSARCRAIRWRRSGDFNDAAEPRAADVVRGRLPGRGARRDGSRAAGAATASCAPYDLAGLRFRARGVSLPTLVRARHRRRPSRLTRTR